MRPTYRGALSPSLPRKSIGVGSSFMFVRGDFVVILRLWLWRAPGRRMVSSSRGASTSPVFSPLDVGRGWHLRVSLWSSGGWPSRDRRQVCRLDLARLNRRADLWQDGRMVVVENNIPGLLYTHFVDPNTVDAFVLVSGQIPHHHAMF